MNKYEIENHYCNVLTRSVPVKNEFNHCNAMIANYYYSVLLILSIQHVLLLPKTCMIQVN